jgi:hypothetical protein
MSAQQKARATNRSRSERRVCVGTLLGLAAAVVIAIFSIRK